MRSRPRSDGGTHATAVHRPRRRQAVVLVLAVLALLAGAVGQVVPGPAPAGAAPEVLPPPSVVTGRYTTQGQLGDVALPDCNSINIDGRGGLGAKWTVTSSLGTGAVVHPGRTWTVRIQMHTNAGYLNTANDGPMPLRVRAVPTGPVESAADPVVGVMSHFAHLGNGDVGPIGGPAQWGPWGADYDQDSDPPLFVGSDGNSVDVTLTLRATEPGYVTLPKLSVTGYDETPIAGAIACSMPIAWVWQVVAPPGPVAGADVAATDVRYADVVPGDAQAGVHTIDIDVLADDDDPNIPGGPGDTGQVRIADWATTSAAGGTITCGDPAQKGLPPGTPLDQLSDGPCRYRPPFDHKGLDTFTYVVRSATGQTSGTVTVQVVPNPRPTMAPAVFGTTVNTDEVFDMSPYVSDPDGDPLTCLSVGTPEPAVGTAVVAPDCTLQWDNTSPGFTGNVTQTVRVCDTSPTLQPPALGEGVTRGGDYWAGGDLDALNGRRCTEADVTIAVLAGLVLPPSGHADLDLVDAGYAADGIGAYSVRLPVLANDTDGNGPDPTQPSAALAVLDGPDPSVGTATVDGDDVVFTPADGYDGPVAVTYRVCEDPLTQDPPYLDDPDTPLVDEGLAVCGVGLISLQVVGNQPPVAGPDQAVVAHDAELVDVELGANDADPEGGAVSCTPGTPGLSEPALVASASVDADCRLDLVPSEGSDGVVDVTYQVCDDHALADPAWPDVPYGDDGRSPGDAAPRCSAGVASVTVVGPAPGWVEPVDPAPVCADDDATTVAGQPVDVDVVANDTDLDAEGQAAPVVLTGPPAEAPGSGSAGGTAALTDDESALAYVPPAGFLGTDEIAYSARDGAGQGCTGVLRVAVTAGPATTTSATTTPASVAGTTDAGPSDVGATAPASGTLPVTGAPWAAFLAGLGLALIALGAGVRRVASARR